MPQRIEAFSQRGLAGPESQEAQNKRPPAGRPFRLPLTIQ
jgi:hypothetical protein